MVIPVNIYKYAYYVLEEAELLVCLVKNIRVCALLCTVCWSRLSPWCVGSRISKYVYCVLEEAEPLVCRVKITLLYVLLFTVC